MYNITNLADSEVMEEDKCDVIDRISQLPEPILQHILSFLVVKDAFRTSVLSKTWNNACATLQFLNFGDRSFFPKAAYNDDQEIFYQKVRDLLNIVDSIIMKRHQLNVEIQKFCLQLPNHKYQLLDLKPYINKFLSSVTEGSIKELVFKVGDGDGRPWYTLPEAVYAANSLIKLNLGGCKLEYSPSGCMNMTKLNSLRELYLSRTHVGNQLFQLLMSNCPELEKLEIDYLYGLDHVQIFGLLKLKSVSLYDCHRNLNKIEIEAPNLEYLCHHGSGLLYIVNVSACNNLKALILHGLIINDKWVADLFLNLPFLENFSLTVCLGLKTVSTLSNRLKKLSLLSCRSLVNVEVNAPNLSSFYYSGNVSLSLSLEALAIENMYFGIKSETSEGSEWHNKFVEFLSNFNHSRIMKMCSRKTAELIIPKELRETWHPPLYDVKHLTVITYNGAHQSMFLDLFDSLLWLAPCLDILTLFYRRSKRMVQFTYETSTGEAEDSCCTSVPSKFRWQNLKKVKFENFQDVEEHWKLKNYFIENGKMLETIEGLTE